MKIERKVSTDAVWSHLKENLPPSLRADEILIGYGRAHVIYHRGYRRSIMDRLFENKGDVVAQVSGGHIELFHPEYYSDFEALGERCERATGMEIKLTYWESSK